VLSSRAARASTQYRDQSWLCNLAIYLESFAAARLRINHLIHPDFVLRMAGTKSLRSTLLVSPSVDQRTSRDSLDNNTALSPPAADAVFGISELLECILCCLTTRELLVARRTCRSWNEATHASIHLKRALFQVPMPVKHVAKTEHRFWPGFAKYSLEDNVDLNRKPDGVISVRSPEDLNSCRVYTTENVGAIHPVIHPLAKNLPGGHADPSEPTWRRLVEISDVRTLIGILSKQSSESLSAFLTQPPCNQIFLAFAWHWHRQYEPAKKIYFGNMCVRHIGPHLRLEDPLGIRIDQVLAVAKMEVWEHHCGKRMKEDPDYDDLRGTLERITDLWQMNIEVCDVLVDASCTYPELARLA
jgi:hypothetical protein